jgi:hypothetical protein
MPSHDDQGSVVIDHLAFADAHPIEFHIACGQGDRR